MTFEEAVGSLQVDAAIGAMKKALNTDINELLAERAKFNGKK